MPSLLATFVILWLQIKMTVKVVPGVKDGCLAVSGKAVLSHVPGNIVVSPVDTESAFLGATSKVPSSRHVFTLGILQ